jgi:hypothetical protein
VVGKFVAPGRGLVEKLLFLDDRGGDRVVVASGIPAHSRILVSGSDHGHCSGQHRGSFLPIVR